MNFDRGELVLIVFIDDCSQLRKVFANLRRTVADDQIEFIKHLFEELVVALDVLQEGFGC